MSVQGKNRLPSLDMPSDGSGPGFECLFQVLYTVTNVECAVNKTKSIIFHFQTDSKYNTYFPRLQAHLGYQKFKGKFLALFRFFFCARTFIKHWIQVENANKACLPIVTTVQSKSTVNKNGFQTSKLTKFFHIAASAQKNGSFSFIFL